jgi:hypothetical protein
MEYILLQIDKAVELSGNSCRRPESQRLSIQFEKFQDHLPAALLTQNRNFFDSSLEAWHV